MGQPWSTTSRASLKRARGVSAALAWDTKTSWVVERFLGSSTPRPEVFAYQAHSDRVVTRSRPTCPVSTASSGPRTHREHQRPPDERRVAAAYGAGAAQPGHPLGQAAEGDRGLQLGQRAPDAVVDAAGERQVLGGVGAEDVERAGVGE